jgi:pimeloyl-ACP methyl ester carboxylesterase
MKKLFLTTLITFLIALMSIEAAMAKQGQFATVNGMKMYYEIHGTGKPLVLIHGGGSTVESTYGRILPMLATKYKVIGVELQAHGHTADRDKPLSFEQDADDVAELLKQLKIESADIMGFSNGGTTALQIAIRHPKLVNKLILASATYKRSGLQVGFFEMMDHASFDQMPQPLKDAYLAANPDQKGLMTMFNRDVARMQSFKDISDAHIKAIQAPTLVINGDKDVVTNEHALEISRTVVHGQLAILPCGHGEYIGEICSPDPDSPLPSLVIAMIEKFLN